MIIIPLSLSILTPSLPPSLPLLECPLSTFYCPLSNDFYTMVYMYRGRSNPSAPFLTFS